MPSHAGQWRGPSGGGPMSGGVPMRRFYRGRRMPPCAGAVASVPARTRWPASRQASLPIRATTRPGRLRYPSPMRKDPVEHLLRGLYSAALYLLVPVTVYHLIWRGFRQPEYFQRWNERYGAYGAQGHAQTVWIHAV